MCLGVDASGWGSGAGTHLSTFVHLMRGEFDDNLHWPFRGDITLQLISCRVDEEHVKATIHFDDSVHDVVSRVTEGERALGGWGRSKFISHSALDCDKNTGFLDKDKLEFRVMFVKVHSTESFSSLQSSAVIM